MPDSVVETMKQDRPADIRRGQNGTDAFDYFIALLRVLFFDLDQDPQDTKTIRDSYKPLGIRRGRKTHLNADPALRKQFHHAERVRL